MRRPSCVHRAAAGERLGLVGRQAGQALPIITMNVWAKDDLRLMDNAQQNDRRLEYICREGDLANTSHRRG